MKTLKAILKESTTAADAMSAPGFTAALEAEMKKAKAAPARRRRGPKPLTLLQACKALKISKMGAGLSFVRVREGRATISNSSVWASFPSDAPDGVYDPRLAIKNSVAVVPGDAFCPRVEDEDPADYPGPDHHTVTQRPAVTVPLDAADLKYVSRAMSKDKYRYYLRGVFFDLPEGTMVASDNSRLHARPVQTESDGPGVIVPDNVISLALKAGAHSVEITEAFSTLYALGGVEILTRNVDGTYPDYQRAIPAIAPEAHDLLVDFSDALKYVRKENLFVVHKDGTVAVVSTEKKVLCGDYRPADALAAYDSRFVKDILNGETRTVLNTADGSSPTHFNAHSPGYDVLMPVRF